MKNRTCGGCVLVREPQSTSIGYWQGKVNTPALSLNNKPSEHNFSSGSPSVHSTYLSHWKCENNRKLIFFGNVQFIISKYINNSYIPGRQQHNVHFFPNTNPSKFLLAPSCVSRNQQL